MLFSNASEPVCYIWKIITNSRKCVDYQRGFVWRGLDNINSHSIGNNLLDDNSLNKYDYG